MFFQALGYRQEEWQLLASDLLRIAKDGAVSTGPSTDYGQKYEVRGRLIGPAGRSAAIVTAWIVLRGEAAPRFVTAFPENRQ